MDGRHEAGEEPARGSWMREAWRGLVPIGVAAGLVLAIGGGFDVLEKRHGESESRSAKAASDAERTAPRFVVGVVTGGSALVVRDAGTGADVGLPVAPPRGRAFTAVESAPDGSYIAASSGDGRVTFQRLRLDDEGRPEELVPLPEAVLPGASAEWSDLAIAPGGDRVAYVTYEGTRGRIDVLTLDTGARKTWTTTLRGRVGSLSWSGGDLSFVWQSAGGGRGQVRTIDTRGPAGDLELSEAVLTLPSGATAAILRPDGTTIVTGRVQGSQLTVQTFSVTGEPGQVIWKQPIQENPAVIVLDPAENGALLALAGDLHTGDGGPLPGKDLADAAW